MTFTKAGKERKEKDSIERKSRNTLSVICLPVYKVTSKGTVGITHWEESRICVSDLTNFKLRIYDFWYIFHIISCVRIDKLVPRLTLFY